MMVSKEGLRGIQRLEKFRFLPRHINYESLRTVLIGSLNSADPGERRSVEPKKASSSPMGPIEKARLARLRSARLDWAKKLGVEPGFLLNNQTLERIAKRGPSTLSEVSEIKGISGWRAQNLASEVIDVVRGAELSEVAEPQGED